MKIVLLAGGISKRMWPLKQDKLLLDFLGKPFFEHVLSAIKNTQLFNEYIIIVNPNNQEPLTKIINELKVTAEIVVQNNAQGMADALLSAKEFIQGEVLIVNADDLLEGQIFEQIQAQKASPCLPAGRPFEADVILSGIRVEYYQPRGYFKLDGDQVVGIVEKPGEGNEPSKMVKLVADYFKDGIKLIEYLKNISLSLRGASDNEGRGNLPDDIYESALDQMLQDGLKVSFNQYSGEWATIKYPWDVLTVMEMLLKRIEQKIDPSVQIAKSAIVEGNVVIEAGVKIFDGAVVKGPAYIGKNCIVGNNSLVRESILSKGSVTGFNTEIARSYVGANSWFHTNYIGDSVIEGDFGMGSGAVLANLRLDGQTIKVGSPSTSSGFIEKIDTNREKLGLIAGIGVRVGVNAAIMPGVRVGANSLIGPGVVLNKDIKEGLQVILKQEYLTSDNSVNTSYNQFRQRLDKD